MLQLDSVLPDVGGRPGRLGHNIVGVWSHEVPDRECDFLNLLYRITTSFPLAASVRHAAKHALAGL